MTERNGQSTPEENHPECEEVVGQSFSSERIIEKTFDEIRKGFSLA
jgi:hypothetical protein